jgi:hypothetical protein
VIELELILAADLELTTLEPRVERACEALGLHIGLKGSLAGFPGCTHWHYRRGRERGTLEITLWPQNRRLWISVHSGRDAPWIHGVMPALKTELEQSWSVPGDE